MKRQSVDLSSLLRFKNLKVRKKKRICTMYIISTLKSDISDEKED